jgi:hypothetical protein
MIDNFEKNLNKLTKKYPEIFKERSANNGMIVPFYFECDDGWYDIIDVLCANIQRENEIALSRKQYATNEDQEYDDVPATASQIKEKFGGLRFYINGGNETIRGMIIMAESMSFRTCEVCGKPGYIRKYSWIKTHCNEHFNQERSIGD